MPRNAQYGRWRRLAMQAVLWVIFGGTLALAGFVSHRRTAPLNADLGEPVSFESLKVRPPRGWVREKATEAQPRALVFREHDEEGRQRRELWITQERQSEVRKKGPTFYLETTSLKGLNELRAEPFNLLGTRGALITWRGVPRALLDLDEEIAEKLPDAGLYACAVLPDGLTVTVQIRGVGAYGPTNQRFIRRVADGITLADRPTSQPVEAERD